MAQFLGSLSKLLVKFGAEVQELNSLWYLNSSTLCRFFSDSMPTLSRGSSGPYLTYALAEFYDLIDLIHCRESCVNGYVHTL